MLGIAGGCGGTQLAGQTARDTDTFPINIGAGLTPQIQCTGIIDKINPDFFQHLFGVGFNDFEGFLG